MSGVEKESVDSREKNAEQNLESEDEDPLKGWTKEDKFYLLQGLKSFGSNSIDNTVASNIVPGKNDTQIKAALKFYKRKASETNASLVTAKKKKGQSTQSNITNKTVPLSSWAKILTETFPFKDLQTETATALRLIANYEDIPFPSVTGNINFRDLYLTMADAIEGKTLSKDVDIMVIMQKCLLETAFDSRSFMKPGNLQILLDSINFKDKSERHLFTRPDISAERVILRNLSSQHSYNPFNIPEEYLRPSKSFQLERDNLPFN